MSAIAGVLSFDRSAAPGSWIQGLTQRMADAGPDSQACWHSPAMSLGHALLRTREEVFETPQPLASQDGQLRIVWDGRLDNREQLEVELPGLRGQCDSAIALAAYIRWGEECVRHFLGDFAFAVWNAQAGTLFCARDPMGARPFFFARTDRFFAFASQDEPLVTLPGVSNAVAEDRVAHFLLPAFLGFDASRSWLREVHALGGGERLVVHANGRIERSTYWRFSEDEERHFSCEEECTRAFRAVFEEAVRCRLPTQGDAALMLSGGLDSGSILGAANSLGFQRLHTYSVISNAHVDCLESDCIRDMTRPLAQRAHFMHVPSFTGIASAQDVADIARSRPHPIDHSLLPTALLCRAASRDGRRIMLTGVCGDLTTHGTHGYIGSLLARGAVHQAWKESRAAQTHHTYLRGRSPASILARNAADLAAPAPLKQLVRHWRGRSGAYLRGSLIHPGFAERVGAVRWVRDRREGLANPTPQQAHIAALMPPYGIASSLGGYNRVAERWGIEIRDPWADRRVVEFWLRLPLRYKFRDGWTKYVVRRSFGDVLPPSVVQRIGKEHVGWNLLYRLMDDTREHTHHVLERELGCVDNFVDVAAAREVYRRFLSTGEHREREKVFDLLTLVAWIKHCQAIH